MAVFEALAPKFSRCMTGGFRAVPLLNTLSVSTLEYFSAPAACRSVRTFFVSQSYPTALSDMKYTSPAFSNMRPSALTGLESKNHRNFSGMPFPPGPSRTPATILRSRSLHTRAEDDQERQITVVGQWRWDSGYGTVAMGRWVWDGGDGTVAMGRWRWDGGDGTAAMGRRWIVTRASRYRTRRLRSNDSSRRQAY